MTKAMRFVCIKKGRYEIQTRRGKVLAKIQKRWVAAHSLKPIIPGKPLGYRPGKLWTRGWWILWDDGRREAIMNFAELGAKYDFTNYPGYGRILSNDRIRKHQFELNV